MIETSDTVVLGMRPQVAEEILSGLRLSASHVVISLVAGFSALRVADLVSPASRIWRAIPLPSAAKKRSPIAIYPAGGPASELFAHLGRVFGVEAEEHLNALSAATSTIASHFSVMGSIASWVAGKGVPELLARKYVACMFAGLADNDLELSKQTFGELAAAHATPGGLNEQVLRDLTDHGVFKLLTEALEAVYRRAAGQPHSPQA